MLGKFDYYPTVKLITACDKKRIEFQSISGLTKGLEINLAGTTGLPNVAHSRSENNYHRLNVPIGTTWEINDCF